MSETATKPKAESKAKTEVIKKSEVGSRKVFLRREPILGHLPKEVIAEAVVKLGCVFKHRQPLRGFPVDSEEEKKYLKGLLDVGPSDSKWATHVRRYWSEIRIPVPFSGTALEIGFDDKGDPLKVEEYVYYCFAKNHIQVADTEEEMLRDIRKKFYIQDPVKDSKKKNNKVQVGKLADREFIKASDNPKRMKNLLTILSKVKTAGMDPDTIENLLYDIKDTKPAEFLKIAQDKDLDMRAEISEFIQHGVLQKLGNTILNMDETMAQDMREAIIHLKNPKNSGLLNTLRVKYRELTR